METTTRGWTLGELADLLGGQLDGPAERRILRPVPAGQSDPEGMTFAESTEYLQKVVNSDIGAVLVPPGLPKPSVATIEVPHPRAAFARFLAICSQPLPIEVGIHPTAIVSPEAEIAASASIGAYVVVERGARIGEGCRIYPFTYIGERCEIGPKTMVYPHAVLYQDVHVGERSIIHSGAVLGADGFGFVWDGPQRNRRIKVPQVGSVELGSDVEVGALTAIDRATAGSTVIGHGTKLDNLIQIGHNTTIGAHTVIASQTAVGGSSTVGSRSDVGGHVAVSDHIHMDDDVIVAGKSGVMEDLKPGAYWGLPAQPIMAAKRTYAALLRLPQLVKRVKMLEKRLEELEQRNP